MGFSPFGKFINKHAKIEKEGGRERDEKEEEEEEERS